MAAGSFKGLQLIYDEEVLEKSKGREFYFINQSMQRYSKQSSDDATQLQYLGNKILVRQKLAKLHRIYVTSCINNQPLKYVSTLLNW